MQHFRACLCESTDRDTVAGHGWDMQDVVECDCAQIWRSARTWCNEVDRTDADDTVQSQAKRLAVRRAQLRIVREGRAIARIVCITSMKEPVPAPTLLLFLLSLFGEFLPLPSFPPLGFEVRFPAEDLGCELFRSSAVEVCTLRVASGGFECFLWLCAEYLCRESLGFLPGNGLMR